MNTLPPSTPSLPLNLRRSGGLASRRERKRLGQKQHDLPPAGATEQFSVAAASILGREAKRTDQPLGHGNVPTQAAAAEREVVVHASIVGGELESADQPLCHMKMSILAAKPECLVVMGARP
jgi:hypothetical protein